MIVTQELRWSEKNTPDNGSTKFGFGITLWPSTCCDNIHARLEQLARDSLLVIQQSLNRVARQLRCSLGCTLSGESDTEAYERINLRILDFHPHISTPLPSSTTMSKASTQRLRARQKKLAQLHGTDPVGFRKEVNRRLASWVAEARDRAGQLSTSDGKPMPATFEVLARAMNAISKCSAEAIQVEGTEIKAILGSECALALAKQIEPRMHRLANTGQVCDGLEAISKS